MASASWSRWEERSAANASTAGPPDDAAISVAPASARARSRPTMPTRAPIADSPVAVARPMPPVPPVTSTTLRVTGDSALGVGSRPRQPWPEKVPPVPGDVKKHGDVPVRLLARLADELDPRLPHVRVRGLEVVD